MEGGIDPDAPLDFVEFQILPSQNSYEACVWSSNRAEKVASGSLEQLLLHSPQVKDLSLKGSNTNFKILPPDSISNAAKWFTKATLTRYLHVVGSPDILSIGNEISQLEETRKFQLSLSMKAEVDLTSSVESKNELLRAVDLRVTALKEELAAALNEATGATCSTNDVSDMGNFAHHFGAKDIRDSLQKFAEFGLFPSVENSSETERSAPIPQRSQLDPHVKYGVSPAKAAQIERQSSTDDESSLFSSEEDQRSRTLARSSTPRRSASPMRRIQIGRSGSRRMATLSIKSLNYFPSKEKAVSQRDATGNSSEEEDLEKPPKNNVLRMSVQDKISLFASRQRDQGTDVQKTKTLNATVGPNKAVLRRWSSGMNESSTQGLPETSLPISPKNVAQDVKVEYDNHLSNNRNSVETAENIKPHSSETGASEPLGSKVDTVEPEREESCEKHPATIEWSQQKEEELNELFVKMMESKPSRHRNLTTGVNKSKNSPKEQRGGFYNNYKQKRDEKLRGEAAGKKVEKEAQFKVMQQFLDSKKAEVASTNVSSVDRKPINVNKPQKTQKNSTQLMDSRKEASKPSIVRKATSKPSLLPATRKSWPSTPSPRATVASPARTPTGTSTSRKPQTTSSAVHSSTPRAKTPKASQANANKSTKSVDEKQKPTVTTKEKVGSPEPSFYNKVTKKSSVVPLETKPFLRKGSRFGPGVGSVIKTKVVAQPQETLTSPGVLIQALETEVVMTANINNQNQDNACANLDLESQMISHTKCKEPESVNQDDGLEKVEMSETEEPTEEEEEHHQDEIIPCTEIPVQISSPAPAGSSSPRVRHSLSQMLLEETSETDIAEHPPAMVCQKDAPKGFKRLLKFARKSHLTGRSRSSPSAFSDGEDDAEESKGQSNMSRFTAKNHRKTPWGHVSSSVSTTKATRSFFSLSAFRGSKTKETNTKDHQRKNTKDHQ